MPLERRNAVRMVVGGGVLLALSWLAAAADTISDAEEQVFRWVNGWPDWLEGPIWPLMQFGAIAMVPLVALGAWVVTKRRRLAVGIASTGFAAWVLAKGVKAIIERGRPQEFLSDVIFRPEWEGLGFVSGHAAVVFAMAGVLSPAVPKPWKAVVWGIAIITGVLRMYTAAHLPLDITGGAGLGIALAGSWHLLSQRRDQAVTDAVTAAREA